MRRKVFQAVATITFILGSALAVNGIYGLIVGDGSAASNPFVYLCAVIATALSIFCLLVTRKD